MFYYPNYKNNIINISAAFGDFLGVKNDFYKNKKIQKSLIKNYKNIVFLILDGFGYDVAKKHLNKNSILIKNIKQKVTSVFPSTTTNATTTLMSMSYPSTHGWFGWSLYFKELDKCIDIYMGQNSYNPSEKIDPYYVINKMPHSAYYLSAKCDYQINTVFPSYVKTGIADNNYFYNSSDQMFDALNNICKKNNKQFIYCYHGEPDYTMHAYGMSNNRVKELIVSLEKQILNLHNNNPDTLIVITADHGHIDIDGYIEIYNDTILTEMLEIPHFLEARARAFVVKPECNQKFVKHFNKNYGKDFKLFKTKKLIQKGVFGAKDIDDYRYKLGDYIAVGKTNKSILAVAEPEDERLKGHHTSLTREMIVPLIILENK